MDNKEIDSPITLQKKIWSTPNFYLLDTNNIHGGPNAGLHENQVVNSSPAVGGRHYIATKTPSGTRYHTVANTRLHYYS